MTIYVNDIGTLIKVAVGTDISTATVHKIKFKKPNGVKGEWAAEIGSDDVSLEYTTVEDDIDVEGTWIVQAYVELPAWSGHSTKAQFTVEAPIPEVVE